MKNGEVNNMKIITKQTLLQEIQYSVQQVYNSGKEVDYIEVSVEEYNILTQAQAINGINEMTLTIKNSNGHSVPTRIRLKRLFNYRDLDFKEFKAYVARTYPTIKIQKNIKHETLLAKIDKIVQETKELSDAE